MVGNREKFKITRLQPEAGGQHLSSSVQPFTTLCRAFHQCCSIEWSEAYNVRHTCKVQTHRTVQ
eukprot:1138866-Pelagomonas_calceolata.AAC.2